jgi:hypothetical protein
MMLNDANALNYKHGLLHYSSFMVEIYSIPIDKGIDNRARYLSTPEAR